MTNIDSPKSEIDRMWEEAELYEKQGLIPHALDKYRSILQKDPDNKRAQIKIVQVQFTQKMESETGAPVSPQDSLSPRQALDLGIAYMGMNLYSEALDEFRKAVDGSPAVRTDLLRHMATCYVHLDRPEDSQAAIEELLRSPNLSPSERGEIISETVSLYLDNYLPAEAGDLLAEVSEEQAASIPDYDDLIDRLSAMNDNTTQVDVYIEDEDTGEIYKAEQVGDDEGIDYEELGEAEIVDDESTGPVEPAIPLRALVSFSVDDETWHEGTSSQLAADWALIKSRTPLRKGESVLLRIFLPSEEEQAPVSVITRVRAVEPREDEPNVLMVRLQFNSFFPGGEARLKAFIDRVVQDPSILDTAVRSTSVFQAATSAERFQALEEEALKEMERRELAEPAETRLMSPESQAEAIAAGGPSGQKAIPEFDDDIAVNDHRVSSSRLIQFACECGQVHSVPRTRVGHKGKCANCARDMTVPIVDVKPDSMTDQVIGKVVGGSRILYKIGGGGMGGVFRGYHLALDIPVAVKILYAHLAEKDQVFIKRFIREARATARLQHPNIVGVMNVGFEDGLHYIIMPFVGGGSAASLINRVGRVGLDHFFEIAIQITSALILAEENNILHRDIKPANILFTDRGEVKLADLGLAKNYTEVDTSITQTGIACGTPLYFSPEQAKGAQDLDIRSDIYSLGITLYHMLEGSPPFKGDSAYVIFQKHVNEDLPPFTVTDPPIPGPVFRLLARMTAKQREERFESAKELLEVLEALRDDLIHGNKSGPKRGLLERLGIKRAS